MRLLLLISILNLSPVAFGADCPTEKVSDQVQKMKCGPGTSLSVWEVDNGPNAEATKKTGCLTPAEVTRKKASAVIQ